MAMNGQHLNSEIVIKDTRTPALHVIHVMTHWREGMVFWISGFILLGLLAIGGRALVIEYDDSPILTYEDIKKPLERSVYFFPDKVQAGQQTQLHLDRVYWFDIGYRSDLVYNVSCLMEIERDGKKFIEPGRRDYPVYPISTPKETGPVDAKWRPFQVPPECLPGRLVYRAFARHNRWPFSPKQTKMPEVFLTVVGQ